MRRSIFWASGVSAPEIAEGQALLAALAEADAWKSAAGSRGRRLKLQTSYGHAMAMSRGFASEEANAAFARVRELATGTDNTAERFAAHWGQWIAGVFRGELGLARETAEIFVRETMSEAWMTEAGVARRMLGLTCLHQGDLIDALAHLEEAARIYDPERDRDAKFRFGVDTGASATLFLAHTRWQLGEIGRAQELIEEAVVRGVNRLMARPRPTPITIRHYSKYSVAMLPPPSARGDPSSNSAESTASPSI